MPTYVFFDVLTDYTTGVAVSRATTKERAISQLLERYDFFVQGEHLRDEYTEKIRSCQQCPLFTSCDSCKTLKKIRDKELADFEQRCQQQQLKCTFGTGRKITREKFFDELTCAKCVEIPMHQPTFAFFIGGGS